MITYSQGNILESEAEALVNTVNCVGVMGRGVALQFKEAYPENAVYYTKACERGGVKPGRMLVFDMERLFPPRYIVNFPTKRHWRANSRIEDIEAGLADLVRVVNEIGIRSIAIPPLGSGLGRLDWGQVQPLIEQAAAQLPDVDVRVYLPRPTMVGLPVATTEHPPRMTAARAALITLMERYLGALMDSVITVLEVHKLLYFLQEAGEPLRLRFVKAPHGPYAENLYHVLRDMNSHYIDVDQHALNTPDTVVHILPGAVEDAAAHMGGSSDTLRRAERVIELVQGYETPFGLELLASVHWLMKKHGVREHHEIIDSLYNWAPSKRSFSESQIETVVNRLLSQSWV